MAITGSDANVGTNADAPLLTIQKGFETATNYGMGVIYVGAGTYVTNRGLNPSGSGLVIGSTNLYFSGGWDNGFISRTGVSELDGQGALLHVVVFQATTNVAFDGFVIRGGKADTSGTYNDFGGGMILHQPVLCLVTNVTVSNNVSYNTGGGVFVRQGMSNFISGHFTGNVSLNGGGVGVHNSLFLALNVIVTSNQAGRAGGLYLEEGAGIRLDGVVVGNNSTNSAGGIYLGFSRDYVVNALILSNTAGNSGGGIFLDYSSNIVLSGDFRDNYSGSDGGGLYFFSSQSNTVTGIVSGNYAQNGGGLHLYYGSSNNVIGGPVFNNSVNWYGAGFYFQHSGYNTVTGAVSGNSGMAGGGLYYTTSHFNRIYGTIASNTASASGGGHYFHASHYNVISNILYNYSPNCGGCVFNDSSSNTNIGTISYNSNWSVATNAGSVDNYFNQILNNDPGDGITNL